MQLKFILFNVQSSHVNLSATNSITFESKTEFIIERQILFRTDLFLLNVILAKRTFVQCNQYLTSHELILFRKIYLIYTIMSQGQSLKVKFFFYHMPNIAIISNCLKKRKHTSNHFSTSQSFHEKQIELNFRNEKTNFEII